MRNIILLGEFLGTFLLILGFLSFNNPLFLGLLYSIILYLLGQENTSYCNPAFTIVRYLSKKIEFYETSIVIIIQCIAGIFSYTIFKLVT